VSSFTLHRHIVWIWGFPDKKNVWLPPFYIIVGIVQVFLIMSAMLSYDTVQHIYIQIVIVKDTLLNQDRFQCVLYLKTLPCVLLCYDVVMKMYN